ISESQADHCAGAEHVQDQFLSSTGFEPGRACYHFRTDLNSYSNLCGCFQRSTFIAGECDRKSAQFPCSLKSGQSKRSVAACAQRDQSVEMGYDARIDLCPSGLPIIFRAFYSRSERSLSTSDSCLYHFG